MCVQTEGTNTCTHNRTKTQLMYVSTDDTVRDRGVTQPSQSRYVPLIHSSKDPGRILEYRIEVSTHAYLAIMLRECVSKLDDIEPDNPVWTPNVS
jgi:hypothetical protein